jgi:chemotaxis signal transduction protein
MNAPFDLETKLASFRDAFDRAFAAAPITAAEESEDLLAIRVAGHAYALRLREIRGIAASRKIVPLPSSRRDLMGIAAIRGTLVAVYSLAVLLGYGADSKPTAWLALVGATDPIGLGFEEFEGFLRVRSTDLHATQPAEGRRPGAGEVVRVDGQSRRVIDIPSTLGTLEVRAGAAGSPQEA